MAKFSNVRFKRIFTLGKERVNSINAAFAAGHSAQALAHRIQVEWDSSLDVSQATLAKQLTRYRAKMLPGLVAVVEPGPTIKCTLPAAFDTLDLLRENVLRQRARVQLGHAKELQAQFPMSSMTADVKALHDMAVGLIKIEFELGLREYRGPLFQHGRVVQVTTTSDREVDVQWKEVSARAREIIRKYAETLEAE